MVGGLAIMGGDKWGRGVSIIREVTFNNRGGGGGRGGGGIGVRGMTGQT